MIPQRPQYPQWYNPIPAPGVPGPGQGIYTGGSLPMERPSTLQYYGQVSPMQLPQPLPQPVQPVRATGLARARQVASPRANIPNRTTNANRPKSALAVSLSKPRSRPAAQPTSRSTY